MPDISDMPDMPDMSRGHARHHPTCLDKPTTPRHMTKPRYVRHLMSYDMPTFPDIPRHAPTFYDMSDKQGSSEELRRRDVPSMLRVLEEVAMK